MTGVERPCEQVGLMPHKPHSYTSAPTDPRDAYHCPGWSR